MKALTLLPRPRGAPTLPCLPPSSGFQGGFRGSTWALSGLSPAWGLSCWSHRPNQKGAGHSSGATGTTLSEAGTHGLQSLSHRRCMSTECISTGFCHQNPHFKQKTKSISQSPLEKIPFMERIQMHGLPGHSGCVEALLWGGWHHRHPSCSVEIKPQRA